MTALVNTSGLVVQRFVYDPYGQATVLTAGWATPGSGDAVVPWQYLHQGLRYDGTLAALYYDRNRELSALWDRFLTNDPKGFAAGDTNFYRDEADNPANATDPSGTDSFIKGAKAASEQIAWLKKSGIRAFANRLRDQSDSVPDGGDSNLALYQIVVDPAEMKRVGELRDAAAPGSYKHKLFEAIASRSIRRVEYKDSQSGEWEIRDFKESDLTVDQRFEIWKALCQFGYSQEDLKNGNGIYPRTPKDLPKNLPGTWEVSICTAPIIGNSIRSSWGASGHAWIMYRQGLAVFTLDRVHVEGEPSFQVNRSYGLEPFKYLTIAVKDPNVYQPSDFGYDDSPSGLVYICNQSCVYYSVTAFERVTGVDPWRGAYPAPYFASPGDLAIKMGAACLDHGVRSKFASPH